MKLTKGQTKALNIMNEIGGTWYHWAPNAAKPNGNALYSLVSLGLVEITGSHQDRDLAWSLTEAGRAMVTPAPAAKPFVPAPNKLIVIDNGQA